MASDPRRAAAAAAAAPEPNNGNGDTMIASKNNILFGGEDDMDVDEDLTILNNEVAGAGSSATRITGNGSASLLDQIITPSPYPQHNSGPTSSRFRNALNRVLQHPDTDVEAWQALLTEVLSCYRNISNAHAVDVETQAKLDWVESCYGHFLRYFPYAYTHAVTVVEILMKQSARFGEEEGPFVDYYGGKVSKRAQLCEAKLEGLLIELLGIVDMEGEIAPIQKATTDDSKKEEANDTKKEEEGSSLPQEEGHLTGICSWVVELWLLYVKKRTRDATRAAASVPIDQRVAFVRESTKKAFEVALPQCGFSHNNQLLWVAYLDFVKSWTVNNLTPGTAEHAAVTQQQMLQLRSIYHRLITHPMTGLDQLWHEYEAWERNQSEALAQALSTEFAPKYQHARTVYLERNRVYNASAELQLGQRLATPPTNSGEQDYASKMSEEHRLLTAWKKRCSYERTNPERLSKSDLAIRVRASYKEMACVMTRHLETWQMWSSFELFRTGIASPSPAEARSVLHLGQELIPDSTLLVCLECRILELYTSDRQESMQVMDAYLKRYPTSLGFVLYQQMVRRYKGMNDARVVFGRARRVLASSDTPKQMDETDPSKAADQIDEGNTENAENVQSAQQEKDKTKRWMVTNKLDPLIGSTSSNGSRLKGEATEQDNGDDNAVVVGPITWHMYAAHAAMEHRVNRCPEIAARVYELGLRKHSSFLTQAAYVIRYAELLLELGDTLNLRALLTRAVAACEAAKGKNDPSLAALWDMTLRCETILSAADADSLSNLESIERRRHQAIMGADVEDVATGSLIGATDVPLIGAQKSSISEHLIRTEGYDVSSSIVGGLGRTVDVLEVMGLWGSGVEGKGRHKTHHLSRDSTGDESDDMPGGKNDMSYHKRLEYATLAASGGSGDGTGADGGGGSRLLTARERLQQAAASTGAGGQTSAIMLAIQQMPEWLRPLLVMLPASRLRVPIVQKPPPQLTEIALATLKQSPLPAERPQDDKSGTKRKMNTGGDSSDEENDGNGSGYSVAFRSRQRARMNSGQLNGAS